MRTYIALFAEGFLFAFVLTPIAIYVFERLGLVDRPDGVRKLHVMPVPRLGGVVLTISISLSLFSLWMVSNEAGWLFRVHAAMLVKIVFPAFLILLIGIVDDLRPLPSLVKFGAQVLAASILWFQGLSFTMGHASPIGGQLWFGVVSYVLTVLWVVGLTNAFNLIDGLDGLAAGVAFLASLTMLVSSLAVENQVVTILMLPVCGALLGFLRYNFNPARIFLGDSGSMLLGFLLAAVALLYAQKRYTLIAITLPIVALGLPIVDTSLSVLRRMIRGTPVFKGDYGHIHHRLVSLGLVPRDAVMVLYGISMIFSVLALVAMFSSTFTAALVISAFCLVVLVGVRVLRYEEFQGAPRLFRTELQGLRTQIALQELCEQVQRAASLEQITLLIGKIAVLLGFAGFRLHLSGSPVQGPNPERRTVAEHFNSPHHPSANPERFWLLTIPFGPCGAQDGSSQECNSLVLYQAMGQVRASVQMEVLVGSLAPALSQAFERVSTAGSGGFTVPATAGTAAGGS